MHFERRLCWLLSSMLEQTRDDCVVNVAHMRNVGEPTCEEAVELFSGRGLDVRSTPYDDFERFQQRGYTRNDQLKACGTPWIWFADCDHVYHPMYVECLVAELEHHADEGRLLTAGRYSTTPGQDPFPFPHAEAVYHQEAFKRAGGVRPRFRRGSCGAGHTQIVKVANLKRKRYVREGKSRDHKWSERGTKAKSDIQFRRSVGGRVRLPRWFSRNQIHLNHRRDSKDGDGSHLTEQR